MGFGFIDQNPFFIMRTLIYSLLLIGLCSCGTFKESAYEPPRYPERTNQMSEADLELASPQAIERKIIKNAYLSLTVEDVDTVRAQLHALAETYQGYVSSGELLSVTLRIKSQYMDQALARIETMGKVSSRTISTNDVTDQYFDLETRIQTLEATRKRYLALLEKATTVPEILPIEKELERLTQELEVLKGRLKRLSDQVAYATITVNLSPKIKPGLLGYVGVGLYQAVKWLFVRN
jgi:hypothetical protein